MKRFTVRLLIAGALFWVLSFSLQLFDPLPWTGFLTSHAQSSWEDKFWVFDAHMHPISSVYRRGGTIGEPNADPRFTLSLAEKGGLGAAFFNLSIDEFYEVNHLAVKDGLKQIDLFYSEIAKYPQQVGVATNLAEVQALRRQGKIAGILAIEGAVAIESDLGVLRMLHRLARIMHKSLEKGPI